MNQMVPVSAENTGTTHAKLPFAQRPILLLFSDDSTLFFCLRMRDCLQRASPVTPVQMAWVTGENALSFRQMMQLLPEGPDYALSGSTAFDHILLGRQFSALVTSRVFKGLAGRLKKPAIAFARERPCVVAFLGGLEFFPQVAHLRRRDCDVVYLVPSDAAAGFQHQVAACNTPPWQRIGFGHPSFILPDLPNKPRLPSARDIYFFPQALSPSTRRGRVHMLRCMAAIARANPTRTVWIKLRHLPEENKNHLHKEKHDYPGLLPCLDHVPPNLKLTACTMDDALAQAGLGITCTSTAAIDLVRANVPCMVHLDFVDNYLDPLVTPMRRLFQGSGLITALEDMLHLRVKPPNANWLSQMFCNADLGARVLHDITRFADRPFQVGQVL